MGAKPEDQGAGSERHHGLTSQWSGRPQLRGHPLARHDSSLAAFTERKPRRVPMRRVLLVRHGESEHHIRGMTGGWTDLPLTKLGKEQAIRTAKRVRELVADGDAAVFASDLLRALMTAEPICRLLSVAMNPVPELREFNNGVAAGLSLSAAKAIEIPPAGDPVDWQPYPGAETWRAMTAR